jgi:gentisate 1,2-dioxygenase
MTAYEEWLEANEQAHANPEAAMPEALVNASADAVWLDQAMTGNPSRIGVLADVPARTMEFYVQELAAGAASDLQRHTHESVHYVTAGSGYSEIGPRTVRWQTGDLIYTPPWVWHRHYNDSAETVTMLLVENSKLLNGIGVAARESAGLVTYAEYQSRARTGPAS